MQSSQLVGSIIVYAICVGLNIAVVWQILDGNAADTWQSFRGLPIWLQVVLGIGLLPWLLAIWIWQTGWALPIRLILVISILWFVFFAFFPKGVKV